MNLPDKIALELLYNYQNEHLDEVDVKEWVELGKCLIMPNTSASKVKCNDGEDFIYSYEIVMRTPKSNIPKENDMVRITKKDGTINKVCKVKGFVTLRNWLKIWV